MPDVSLLTPELRAHIGRLSAPLEVTITPVLASRALEVYRGVERRLGPGDIASPFVLLALEHESARAGAPAVLPLSLLTTDEVRVERPLRVGETLVAQSSLQDIQEHFGGRFGYSLVFRMGTEFRDASGALVGSASRSMMQYDRPDGAAER